MKRVQLPEQTPSFNEQERDNRLLFYRLTRAPIILILGYWTVGMLFRGLDWIFLDGVNLLFHEAGHFFLSFASQGIYVLGGTLGQLVFPAVCIWYFTRRRKDKFATAGCLWWLGENFRNIARYMADAAFQHLPITGEIHDWAFLSRRWGFLSTAQEIASAIRTLGSLCMLAGLAYLIWVTVFPPSRTVDEVLAAED